MKHLRYIVPVGLLILWQISSWLDILPSYKIPSPIGIILGLKDLLIVGLPPGYGLIRHALESLWRVLVGFGIASCIAIPLGILMGWSRGIREAISPLVELIRPIPPLAWIPIAILWFGIGIKSAAFIIFLGAFFPILLNTILGVTSVDVVLKEASYTLGARTKDILLKVLTPGAMPSILTGLRVGLGIGWMTLVAAEFTGIKTGYGLGYMIMVARDIQRPDEILAGMLAIGLIGYGMDTVLRAWRSRILRWR